jgi:DNA-binding transcriptional MerR regulator
VSGLGAAVLRGKGLIRSVGRSGLRRVFEPGVVDRLALIGLGRAAGFSLDEIARLFSPRPRPRIDRGMLAAKAEELDARSARMTAMRDSLRHAPPARAEPPRVPPRSGD